MPQNNDELYHYGVLGMKWGVKRATKKFNSAKSSGDKEKASKALSSLNKHKSKITKKLKYLNDENADLQKQKFKIDIKYQPKIAELDRKIAKYESKSYNAWTERGQMKNAEKATKLTVKVNKLKANSAKVKAAINKNEALTRAFSQTLSDVDSILVANGKKYLK